MRWWNERGRKESAVSVSPGANAKNHLRVSLTNPGPGRPDWLAELQWKQLQRFREQAVRVLPELHSMQVTRVVAGTTVGFVQRSVVNRDRSLRLDRTVCSAELLALNRGGKNSPSAWETYHRR